MKKSIKHIPLIIGAAIASISFGVSSLFFSHSNILFADPISYEICFNQSKNKLHPNTDRNPYGGDTTIKTELGNDVGISFSGVRGISTSWHVFENGGYFTNTTPILGITSLTATFNTDDVEFSIYYSGSTEFSDDRYISYTSSKNEATICDFNGFMPSYFKFVNNGTNLNVSSANIELSCVNNYPLLTAISENETMGTVSGGGAIKSGEYGTIVATPFSGYRFVGWFNGSSLVSTDSSYSILMEHEDMCFTAKFAIDSYNLIIEPESSEKGTVSNSSGTYEYMSNITIEAFANNGYAFSGWYSGEDFISLDNPYSFSMPYSNTVYTARFSTNSYTLTTTNNNQDLGSISNGGEYFYNSSVTVVATPNTGVSFLGWFYNDELIAISQSYTFNMPYYDYKLVAKFEWTPYTVTVNINDDSMGSITGDGGYIYNQQVNLIATPNEHYSFVGWFNGEELVSTDTHCTFNMPTQSIVYEARFTKNYLLTVYSDDESLGTVSAPATEWGAGLEVTVSAIGKTGYGLDHWEDINYNEVSRETNYSFIMPDHNVELWAVFEEGFLLTLSCSDLNKGSASGSGYYVAGNNATVIMNCYDGDFKGWYEEQNVFLADENPYTFVMPANNYHLEGKFTKPTDPFIYNNEKTMTYGLYPQSNIDSEETIEALNSLVSPELNDWYLYENNYYVKQTANPYSTNSTFDNGTTIIKGMTYWFKCDLIVWDVISSDNGVYHLLANRLLDKRQFHNTTSYPTDDEVINYPNNYEYSKIRNWLNNTFLSKAFYFDSFYIKTTEVDNSKLTTQVNLKDDSNPYVCNNTYDKVFLPSYREIQNLDKNRSQRNVSATDYLKAKSVLYSNYYRTYWTRSPYKSNAIDVTCFCGSNFNELLVTDSVCVRPSLNVTLY